MLKERCVGFELPDWSPTGDWITYRDEKGWNLISPDGKTSKFLGKIETPYLAFSKDGKLLYGIQIGETEADQDRATLFSLDPATLKQKVIKELGKDLRYVVTRNLDFSLAPDGKSFVYSAVTTGQRPLDAARLPPARPLEPDQGRLPLRQAQLRSAAWQLGNRLEIRPLSKSCQVPFSPTAPLTRTHSTSYRPKSVGVVNGARLVK